MTILSIPVLRERVAPMHWAAIGVGMGGVWIALRPNGEAFFSLGALAVLGAATCYAVSAIAGRVLSRTDAKVSLGFLGPVSSSVGAGLLALPSWGGGPARPWLGAAGAGHHRLHRPAGHHRGVSPRAGLC